MQEYEKNGLTKSIIYLSMLNYIILNVYIYCYVGESLNDQVNN